MHVFVVIKILALEELGIRYVILAIDVSFQQIIHGGERNVLMVRLKNVADQRSLLWKS